ncbi:MAG: malectin domain-containing carbohydrate-binding protein [Capsulimonadaceae bacterium]
MIVGFGRRMLPVLILWAALALAALAAPDTSPYRPLPTDRGRVVVDHSLGFPRLLTDKGTPLRGAAIPWDARHTVTTVDEVPSQETLDRFATVYGMNAVHLYLEKFDTNPDGSTNGGVNEAACDLMVDRCSKAGLYLIITIGNGNAPNLNCYFPSMNLARTFWKVYAPRYSQRTHVIYEIQNEPGPEVQNLAEIMSAPDQNHTPQPVPANACSDGQWTEDEYRNEVELYNIIRSRAPESHIMMFSWCDFDNADKAREAVAFASAHGVDWTRTSVSIHGYVEAGLLEPTIQTFLADANNPAALDCTEVSDGPRADEVQAYEAHHVGWLLFTWADNRGGCLDALKQQFDDEGVFWKPELGAWPDPTAKHVRKTSHGPVKINAAGPALRGWLADIDYHGGTPAAPVTDSIDTTSVVDPAPQAVYQTERYGAQMTYTIPDLAPGASYTVRLHMCENYWTAPGKRVFNVVINGRSVLTNFDLFATVGATHKAIDKDFVVKASNAGVIVIDFTAVTDNGLIDGIEVNPVGSS